jgi:hypothetical protein
MPLLTMEQQGQSKTYAPSQDVFISYCIEDRKVAEAIKAFLVSRGFQLLEGARRCRAGRRLAGEHLSSHSVRASGCIGLERRIHGF